MNVSGSKDGRPGADDGSVWDWVMRRTREESDIVT
jgi:hypothetical protein